MDKTKNQLYKLKEDQIIHPKIEKRESSSKKESNEQQISESDRKMLVSSLELISKEVRRSKL